MLGVILAAGVGSRLRPMTRHKPKCLVTTAGQPILQYQIDAYRAAGVRELVIVVGYEGDAVKDYCKHIKDIAITIVENDDYESTNNMYSLYLARTAIAGRGFILNNADLSIEPAIVQRLVEHSAADAIAVDSSVFNDESMKVKVNAAGFVTAISKQIAQVESAACSIDFYKFGAPSARLFLDEVARIIEDEGNRKDWTEVAMHRLFQSQALRFAICDIAGLKWVEVDNHEDLALSDRLFSGLDARIADIENVFLDLDGTIYVGKNPVPGAPQAVTRLQGAGKNVYFLSNNSSKAKSDYVARLGSLGIETREDRIVLSTDGVLAFLKDARVCRVYVLGTSSLKKTFIDSGFEIDSTLPEYVVVGYDSELSYPKLISACRHINAGVDIIATHGDAFCPSEHGPIPDVGALLEMIRVTTGKTPVRIFGKPHASMLGSFLSRQGLDASRSLIVGDRLHTDIQMARNMGSMSLLVLSGETTRDQVEASAIRPDFILPSLAGL